MLSRNPRLKIKIRPMPNKTPGMRNGSQSACEPNRLSLPARFEIVAADVRRRGFARARAELSASLRRRLRVSGMVKRILSASEMSTHNKALRAEKAKEFQMTPGTARQTPG